MIISLITIYISIIIFVFINIKATDSKLYFQISDLDSVDRSTHGFSKDGIPLPLDVVRIDVVGGFAIQKVTDNRSYFR